jgi:hypothetical protein
VAHLLFPPDAGTVVVALFAGEKAELAHDRPGGVEHAGRWPPDHERA